MRNLLKQWTDRISDRTGRVLLYGGGLLLVAIFYFVVFQNLNVKCQEMETKVASLKQEETQLIAMKNKQKENEAAIFDMEEKMGKLLSQFPADVKEEDAILHAAAIEEDLEVTVTDMRFKQRNLMAVGEKTGYSLMARPVEYTFSAGYKDMKSMIAEISESGDMRNVENITVGYDGETGLLQGTMATNYYSIEGNELEYKAPNNLGIPLGNQNIFGTAK